MRTDRCWFLPGGELWAERIRKAGYTCYTKSLKEQWYYSSLPLVLPIRAMTMEFLAGDILFFTRGTILLLARKGDGEIEREAIARYFDEARKNDSLGETTVHIVAACRDLLLYVDQKVSFVDDYIQTYRKGVR